MTLYDLFKENGTGKGEDVMWKTIATISDYLEEQEIDTELLMRDLYADMCGCHYNSTFADEQIRKMFYVDKNELKHYAPYWNDETISSVWNTVRGLVPSTYNEHDFKVALNMIKSDYGMLLEDWFPDSTNKHIIDMTVAYLNDADAEHKDCKIWYHYN